MSASPRPSILLDTNVLIWLPYTEESSFWKVLVEKFQPCICLQNLCEFLSVATRSRELNGLGKSLEEALEKIKGLCSLFKVITDNEKSVSVWTALCEKLSICGRQVHDAKLVATALSNGVLHILTNNVKDFNRITEINTIEPNQLIDGVKE